MSTIPENESEFLAAKLARIVSDGEYCQHVVMDAVCNFTASVIHHCADDHGAGLRALLDQFVDELESEMTTFPHDEAFHNE